MDLKTIFGTNVRNQRKARKIGQDAIAEQIEMSVDTIGNIERGDSPPSFGTVEKIAAALDISPLVLFNVDPGALVPGPRGELLIEISSTLADMNEGQLRRVSKILKGFLDR